LTGIPLLMHFSNLALFVVECGHEIRTYMGGRNYAELAVRCLQEGILRRK
jgi:hypothetical protein